MGIVSWIIFGFIAGTIARFIHPGRDPGGCLVTILLGIGGALVGGYVGTSLGWGRVNGFDIRSLGLAVMGALILLIVYRMLFGKKKR
ncbi:MAG: GlsB/YeaQ/YmgE family stress response membrane protein [Gemmatimonadetes bacterium]|nr:GlsB/YeaQ/YmgE family stress response membrane protein [Gemmatimonadota bacterium]NIO31721.1 GlsB/YeaQ/YmgE family stress response membrane protein [Gemmatimonadota bacterium]